MSELLESVTNLIEKLYDSEDGPSIHLCPTGEPYVSLVCGGIKPEGAQFKEWRQTEFDAVQYWLESFLEYARGKKGKLYWRWRPRLHVDDKTGRYQVWSRVVITDQPVEEDFINRKGRYEFIDERPAA